MKQHKWHKEIKAWADGAEIEVWDIRWNKWVGVEDPTWNDEIDDIKYRIKPQENKETDKEWNRRMAEKALAIPEISDAVDRLFEAFAVKEPQYLYVYQTINGIDIGYPNKIHQVNNHRDKFNCIGKIKLEDADD